MAVVAGPQHHLEVGDGFALQQFLENGLDGGHDAIFAEDVMGRLMEQVFLVVCQKIQGRLIDPRNGKGGGEDQQAVRHVIDDVVQIVLGYGDLFQLFGHVPEGEGQTADFIPPVADLRFFDRFAQGKTVDHLPQPFQGGDELAVGQHIDEQGDDEQHGGEQGVKPPGTARCPLFVVFDFVDDRGAELAGHLLEVRFQPLPQLAEAQHLLGLGKGIGAVRHLQILLRRQVEIILIGVAQGQQLGVEVQIAT